MKKILRMIILLLSATSFATTYYVAPTGSDSNSGSSSTPWKTITHANIAAACGSTVIVENGTYIETVNLGVVCTSSTPRVFKSQNKWGAKIAPTNAQMTAQSAIVVAINGAYNILQDFEITGAGDGGDPTSGSGIKIQSGATGSQALGNNIHDIDRST